MKKTVALLFILVAAMAMADRTETEWKGRYRTVLKTIKSRNVAAFKALFSNDFVWVDPKGNTENRDQIMKELDEMFSATKLTGDVKVKKVTVRGDLVDVTFDMHMVEFHKGKGAMAVHEKGVDTWKKIDGKWMFVKTVDSIMTMAPRK